MARSTKVTGPTTCRMARAKKRGRTDRYMKACTAGVSSTARASISGVMGACMQVNGSTTRLVDRASTCGPTVASTLVPGRRTRCTGMVNSRGLTVDNTKVTSSMI